MHPPPLLLPSSRRRAKRNDVPAAAASARPTTGLLAHAQLVLPGVGAFGVGVYATEDKRMARAVFYRHVGGPGPAWESVGDGTFDMGRLWLWTALEPEDEIGLVILRGLNQSLLATPFARDRAARIALTSQRFHGDRPPEGPLADPLAEATRVMIARKSCAKPGKGPDPAPIALGLFEDLCHQPDGRFDPAAPGSGCDQLLSAVRRTSAPPCNLLPARLDCPRRVSREDLAMALHYGELPFDSSRPHEPGSIPCCTFHPTMQTLLALRRAVRARVMATPGATEEDVRRATDEAEGSHPLRAAWAACREEARHEAEGALGGRASHLAAAGNTKDARMSLYIALYHAMQGNDPEASSYLGALQQDDPTLWDFSLSEDASVLLTEHIHPYAHESGNPAYVMWTHKLLKRDASGAVACTYTQRAQASRARHKEAMKASKPAPRRK